ncbi:MAG: OsmC family protein, partial [Pseudomonadota bacterium]
YLPATLAAEDGTVSGAVTVEETGISLYQNSVCVGSHRLLADEPPAIGGNDTGPDPYDYVTAGLGACTSITLRMYANRKKWPLDRIRVRLSHAKDYAADCEACDPDSKVDIFERIIELDGNLDPDQRHRLLEIADKCPVHRTLESIAHVRTRLE